MQRADGGLTASALSHEPQCLSLFNGKTHVINGLHVGHGLPEDAPDDREVHFQVFDLKERIIVTRAASHFPSIST